MDSLFRDKVIPPSVKQPDSRASSVTLAYNDSQTSDTTLVPEEFDIKQDSRPSYFNPTKPGSPHLRPRPLETTPPAFPKSYPIIQKKHDDKSTLSYSPLGENIQIDISEDTPMQDYCETSTQSNHYLSQKSAVFTSDEELIAQQASLQFDDDASQAESSNAFSTHQAPKTRLRTNPPVNIANVIAIQRAMVERKLRGVKQTKSTQAPVDDSTVVQSTEDDHSWMNEDLPVDEEYDELIREFDALQQRQNNGKITNAESITLSKLRKELLLKNRLKMAAANAKIDDDEDESLFVSETREEAVQRHARSAFKASEEPPPTNVITEGGDGDGEDGEMTEDVGSEKWFRKLIGKGGVVAQTKKPRRKAVKNAREFYTRERQDRQTKERQKEQKKKSRKATKTTSINTNTKTARAQKKKKGGVKANKDLEQHFQVNGQDGQDRVDGLSQRILHDLMSSDQIADRVNDPFFDTAPEGQIYERNKSTQLQKLLNDVPHGSNTKRAVSDKVKLLKASRSFGFARVKAEDGKWRVKGMKSTLYHHQLLGAQWMLSRELGQSPFGGLLADVMGLGKTVQTLACMVGNLPQEDDLKRKRKATLIVAPSSVINQWMDEIRVHVESPVFPKIYHYTSKSMVPPEVLEDIDIVVTSYTEVMRQLPYPDPKSKVERGSRGYSNWLQKNLHKLGDLFKVSWYRVVLDEAHAIKNNSARTSIACQYLKSLYRWCLTGTPLLNRLGEMYPYLRFIGADYDIDWEMFQKQICNPQVDESYARLIALLSHTMLRRTMKSSILNRPIIILPKPHPHVQYVDFSPQERIIYRITEDRFRSNISTFFEQGTAAANYRKIFVLLLRLRQCTTHPFMMEQTIREFWTSEDVQTLKHGLSKFSAGSIPFYEQCEAWVKDSETERRASAKENGNGNLTPDSMAFGTSEFGHYFKMDKELASLSEEEMFTRVACGICGDLPENPMKTDCGDIFCGNCLEEYMHSSTAADDFECFICPTCDRIFTETSPYKGMRFDDEYDQESVTSEDESGEQSSRWLRQKRKRNGPGTDEMGFEPKTKHSSWITMSDQDHESSILPSVKMAILKTILLKGFEEAPMDKVVVYVQFRLSARIIGRICKQEGWKFLYLTGDTTLDHRSKAIKMFRDNDDVKILIAGLKCGGLGLNFPWANRCISLDLWWNHATEQQAFGRIFRIGQQKETYMTRIVVRNTIDMRLLSMQLYKMGTCEKVIGERAQNKPTLGLADLARLFGFLKTGKDDNIIEIQADYKDENHVLEHQDEPMLAAPMSDGDVHVGDDWSFGDDPQDNRSGTTTNAPMETD